ncbi:MAG: hypothetical protein IPP45_11245 [Sphingomonadales bacterium]|nr:hypothetical protein [Sphingomonadales bacterium]
MMAEQAKFEIDRMLISITYTDFKPMQEVYTFRSAAGNVQLDGFLFRPKGRPSKTLIMYMHPTSTLHHLPMPMALVHSGFHVLCAGSRYNRNESALIMESAVRDYGAYVQHRRSNLAMRRSLWPDGLAVAR